jgi:hypothetical protein
MEKLLTDIQDRLAAAPMPDGHAQPRKNDRLFEYVDLDWGQCDFYAGQMPPVKFPCALLDINAATYPNALHTSLPQNQGSPLITTILIVPNSGCFTNSVIILLFYF